jgi:uncharacterized membrane protein
MKVLLFATILFSGLVAGLLYSYSTSVNPGLKALPDNEYIRAMQSINTAIQNPVFFIAFMGLLLLFPFTTYLLYNQVSKNSFYLFALAMAIYFIGVFGVTMFFNVPLNEQLAKFSLSTASQNEISAMRELFEKPWNRYHAIRTILSILSFGLTILSVLKQKS